MNSRNIKGYVLNLLILFSSGFGFSQVGNSEIPREAKLLSDSAFNMFMKANGDISTAETALNIVDQSIQLHPGYLTAYSNKVRILLGLKKYQEAIATLKVQIGIKKDFAEAYGSLGFIYDKLGNTDSARVNYVRSMEIYKQKSIDDPNNILHKLNYSFMLLFIDKRKGEKSFKKLVSQYPKEQAVLMMKEFFENFKRAEFIENFCRAI